MTEKLEQLLEYIRDKIEDVQLRFGDARDELDFLETSLDDATNFLNDLEAEINELKQANKGKEERRKNDVENL